MLCCPLFNVVNNIVKHCYTQLQAGFRLNNLFSIVYYFIFVSVFFDVPRTVSPIKFLNK